MRLYNTVRLFKNQIAIAVTSRIHAGTIFRCEMLHLIVPDAIATVGGLTLTLICKLCGSQQTTKAILLMIHSLKGELFSKLLLVEG